MKHLKHHEALEGQQSAFPFEIWSCHVPYCSILKQLPAWLIAICRSGWDVQQSNLRQLAQQCEGLATRKAGHSYTLMAGEFWLFDGICDDCKSKSSRSSYTDGFQTYSVGSSMMAGRFRLIQTCSEILEHGGTLHLKLLYTSYTGYVSRLWTYQKVFVNKDISTLLNAQENDKWKPYLLDQYIRVQVFKLACHGS